MECYIRDGKGTVPAEYLFNGRSLCSIDFWAEVKPPSTEVAVPDKPAPRTRGTRVPEHWVPMIPTIEKMAAELHVSQKALEAEHRKFMDHFLSVPGQRGVKLDWDRTWCNWMRTAAERGNLGVTMARTSRMDEKVSGWMEIGNAAASE